MVKNIYFHKEKKENKICGENSVVALWRDVNSRRIYKLPSKYKQLAFPINIYIKIYILLLFIILSLYIKFSKSKKFIYIYKIYIKNKNKIDKLTRILLNFVL